MALFFDLLTKLLPLYILLPFGFIASRYLDVRKESFAKLLIYLFAPALTFVSIVGADLPPALIALPLALVCVSVLVSLCMYAFARLLWQDGTERIVAYAAGSGNTGYFGIPACIALLGQSAGPIAVMYNMGYVLYENTYGVYMMARGKHSPQEALHKLYRLPLLYAFAAALLCSFLAYVPPTPVMQALEYARGGFVPAGMLLLGAALADAAGAKAFDLRLTLITFLAKFIVWPALAFLAVAADTAFLHLFDPTVHGVIIIESLVPVAANTVAYAALWKVHPERAAVMVLVSTALALFLLPLGIMLLGYGS